MIPGRPLASIPRSPRPSSAASKMRKYPPPRPGNGRVRRPRSRRAPRVCAELLTVHCKQRPVAVAVGLHLMPFGDECLDGLREGLGDSPLHEEGPLYACLVEHRERAVEVANYTFGDRCVVVETRLVPILDIHRNACRGRIGSSGGVSATGSPRSSSSDELTAMASTRERAVSCGTSPRTDRRGARFARA